MVEIFAEIVRLAEAGEKMAVATLVSRLGSAPGALGAKMLVRADGTFLGSIGGGCVEADVWQACMTALKTGEASILSFRLTAAEAAEGGLICGGKVKILIEPVSAEQLPFYSYILDTLQTGNRLVVSTILPSDTSGDGPEQLFASRGKALWSTHNQHQIEVHGVSDSGSKDKLSHGSKYVAKESMSADTSFNASVDAKFDASTDSFLLAEIQKIAAQIEPEVKSLLDSGAHGGVRSFELSENGCIAQVSAAAGGQEVAGSAANAGKTGGADTGSDSNSGAASSMATSEGNRSLQVLLEVFAPRSTVYVFGAGHLSKEIVPLARRVGFRTVVVDDRAFFVNRENFPDADDLVVAQFETVLSALSVDEESYLIIVTRGHQFDGTVLEQALRLDIEPAYIGMIGSRSKIKALKTAIMSKGLSQEKLDIVYAPIGVSISAKTPGEIAISIVAELISVRAKRAAG